jgi:hypothetical protein
MKDGKRKDPMGQIVIGFALIAFITISLLVSELTHYLVYEVRLYPAAILAGLVLWVWMLVDFVRTRKAIRKRVAWGISLILGSWIAALGYFIFIYSPRQEAWNRTLEWKSEHSKMANLFEVAGAALCITVLHRFVMANIYLVIGIPFPTAYNLVVNKLLYGPLAFVLALGYSAAGLDTSIQPSDTVRFIANAANFSYTFLLFLIVVCVVRRFMRPAGRAVVSCNR